MPGVIKRTLQAVPLTAGIIIASVVISLSSGFGKQLEPIMRLFITDFAITPEYLLFRKDLPEIANGELWRLVTPIFVHFGVLHLVFNMLWTWDLGRVLEVRLGKTTFVIMILLFAIGPNLCQFYVSGPSFGGMSGVVYGFLSYIFVRGHLDSRFGIKLKKEIAIFMLVWFVICWVGLIGNVANTAHTVGLVLGVVLALAQSFTGKRS